MIGGFKVAEFSLNLFITMGLTEKFIEGEILQVCGPFYLPVADKYCMQLFAIIQPGCWSVRAER